MKMRPSNRASRVEMPGNRLRDRVPSDEYPPTCAANLAVFGHCHPTLAAFSPAHRHAVSASDVGQISVADALDRIIECFCHDRASIVRRMAPLASPSTARGNSTACLRLALSNALILAATSSAVPAALRVKTISSLTARIAS